MLTIEDVRAMLKQRIAATGTAQDWGVKVGVSATYISDVLNGRRDPGELILNALGLERVVLYREVAK